MMAPSVEQRQNTLAVGTGTTSTGPCSADDASSAESNGKENNRYVTNAKPRLMFEILGFSKKTSTCQNYL